MLGLALVAVLIVVLLLFISFLSRVLSNYTKLRVFGTPTNAWFQVVAHLNRVPFSDSPSGWFKTVQWWREICHQTELLCPHYFPRHHSYIIAKPNQSTHQDQDVLDKTYPCGSRKAAFNFGNLFFILTTLGIPSSNVQDWGSLMGPQVVTQGKSQEYLRARTSSSTGYDGDTIWVVHSCRKNNSTVHLRGG